MDTISGLPDRVGETVTIGAWVTGARSSGRIVFLHLRDGSGFVQAVVTSDRVSEGAFAVAKAAIQESSVVIGGVVQRDPRSPTGVEINATELELISRSEEYPITPKEHGAGFLLGARHLHLRHRRPWATMRIRDTFIRALQDFFAERGFIRFDAPIFMPTAVEGTSDLFAVDILGGDEAYLSQSGQLYAEAGALAHGKVYTLGPVFRAEKSKTRKHLLEFWMVEPEVAFLEHEGNMKLQEDLLCYLIGRVLEERVEELAILQRDTRRLETSISGPYPRMTYDEAVIKLAELDFNISWGDDLGAPHETALGNLYDCPLFIEAWPTTTKAFYMEPFDSDPTRVKANDVIAPEGYGEIIGGSQRIHDADLLKCRVLENNLPMEAFNWYVDLRRYGSVPHSGFGLGIERTLAWITGAPHLRDTIPFPRILNRIYP
jgi:asparaginyl-tRNA synthetase